MENREEMVLMQDRKGEGFPLTLAEERDSLSWRTFHLHCHEHVALGDTTGIVLSIMHGHNNYGGRPSCRYP